MDSKDYEHIRCSTLLFFLDRLLDKGQPRTLHDLSCQFGTKGFTKEMRQIAGGSQSGLRKFLQKYPSLFTIEGDNVYMTNMMAPAQKDSDKTDQVPNGKRDYSVEATNYFREKLEQYGCAEVPIKSLLGHRSQAPPEVRHMSGQHVREFKDFLAKFPEVFVVKDDFVILRKNLGELGSTGNEMAVNTLEIEAVDQGVMNNLLNLFRSLIESNGPMLIEQLFDHLCRKYPRETWSKLVKNHQDLSTFLKMHSTIFQVQSNLVSLVPAKQMVPFYRETPVQSPPNNSSASPTSNSPPVSPQHAKLPVGHGQSFRQRVFSQVMKAVADNTALDQRDRMNYSAPENDYSEIHQTRVLKTTKIVNRVKESQQIIQHLMNSDPPVVSIDGEGVNLGPSGPITLLQMATMSGQVFLFDLVTTPNLVIEGGLKELLESTKIIKVIHDCRNDSGALYHQYGVTLNNIFDTQAAHSILQLQQTGKPVYKVKNISLNTLCKIYGGQVNPKRDHLKKIYRRDQKFWSRRPMTEDMILCAAYDVLALVPTVYEAMKSLILDSYQSLFNELCQEQIDTFIYTDEIKQAKKQRKIDTEVAELRKKLASTQGKNVVLSNREIRLLRYVELTEEEKEKLEGSYKVAKKLERLHGKTSDSGSIQSGESSDELEDLPGEYNYDSSGKTSPDSLSYRSSSHASPLMSSNSQLVEELVTNGQRNNKECTCNCRPSSAAMLVQKPKMVDAVCQTLSTGEIVITKVFFEEKDANKNKNNNDAQ